MKKVKSQAADDEMRPEYDFSGAVRGKYYAQFQQGSSIVLLEPDVSAAFPTSAAVNEALRALASSGRKGTRVMRRPRSPKRRPKRMQMTRSAKARRRGPRS